MKPNQENRRDYYILIGKDKCGDYIFLDRAFKHTDNFKGLCGTRMQFHTEDEYERDKRNYFDSDDMLYLWKESVANDKTTQGYDDRVEDVEYYDADSLVYDTSYRWERWIEEGLEIINEKEGTELTADYSDCTGGGRMFDDEMLKRSYWERVVPVNFRTFKRLFNIYEK